MRVSSTAKSHVAMAATPAENSRDAQFAVVLASTVRPVRNGSGNADSNEAREQSDTDRNQISQTSGGAYRGCVDGMTRSAKLLDPGSCLSVEPRTSRPTSSPEHIAGTAAEATLKGTSTAKREGSNNNSPSPIRNANAVLIAGSCAATQPLAPIGCTIGTGRVTASVPVDDTAPGPVQSRNSSAQNPGGDAKDLNRPVTKPSDDPGHGWSRCEAWLTLDLSLDKPADSSTCAEGTGVDQHSSLVVMGQSAAAQGVLPASTVGIAIAPVAKNANSANPAPVPMETTQSQPKCSSADSSASPARPAERDGETSKATSALRPGIGGDHANSISQDNAMLAVTAKTSSDNLPGVQNAPQAIASHASSPAASGSDKPAHTAPTQNDVTTSSEAGTSALAPGVNTARLMQSLQQTEMRVGVRSAEFGEVSIRSAFSQQQVVAQISAAHSELARAISDYLPSLQAKLDHYGVHASVEVSHTGMSSGSERDQASARDQRPRGGNLQGETAVAATEHEHSAARSDYTASGGRIDIRA